MVADRAVEWPVWPRCPIAAPAGEQQLAAGPMEHDPSIVPAEAAVADPGDLAEGAELVEQARLVAGDSRRQHVALEHGCGNRHSGELVDDLREPLEGGAATELRRVGPDRDHALPGRQE